MKENKVHRKAVYPGTFDPLTNGHLDIMKRALNIFGEITVLLARNPAKQTFFSLDERIAMINESINEWGLSGRIKVDSFEGLLVDYCRKNEIGVIVRGIRPLVDFDYEFEMAMTNRELNSNVETIFILTDQKYFYLRSTLVKDIVKMGGEISSKVPSCVIRELKKKFN